jgi:hypothetical protein
MEVSDQLHAPISLPWEKSLQYPLERRLDGPQSQSGNGEEKKALPLPGIKPWSSSRQAVLIMRF